MTCLRFLFIKNEHFSILFIFLLSTDIRTKICLSFLEQYLMMTIIADDATRKIICDKKNIKFLYDKEILWYIQNSILMFKCVKKYKNSRNFYFTANKLSVECSKKIYSFWNEWKKKYIKMRGKNISAIYSYTWCIIIAMSIKIVWDYGSLFVVNLQ